MAQFLDIFGVGLRKRWPVSRLLWVSVHTVSA